MATDKVKVAVRVRPFNRREIELGTQCVIEMDGQQTIIHHPSSTKGESRKQPKTFAFDHCFWSCNESDDHYASQEEVYKNLGADILDTAFQGYNACIFAYGQTGSGKSYTMMGSEDNKGLIPRMCDSLFERVASETDPAMTHKVEVSYMEIYNEKVHDLLDPKGTKQTLRVREHNILGPYVDGLSTLAVSKFEEINNLMTEGNKSRTVAATNMNNESSRSHAVFNITLTSLETDKQTGVTGEKVSKMSLVDLAGSERAVKTGAVAERLKEGSNINKSLTTLGLVISKLADQASGKAKDKFVPYRDSVLTWLLKDNLGGNSKTVMVATISPSADNYEETLSTLRYADRAKRIVNHAVVNEDPNARIIRELREEVEMLRDQLKHATQQEDVHERLVESEKLMKEMSQTWEEKLHRTEIIHQERQQALEKMGISVQASGIKVEKDKYYLVNLNADPSLNELLVYYLKEQTLIGRPDAPVEQDIQLSGLGIMPEHCIIAIENCDIYITPMEGARTCVNGSVITSKTQIRHGDRVLWGNNHFFRVNCPKANTLSAAETPDHPIDYEFAREELMMKELSNDPIQSAVKVLERQHEEDKHNALEKQRVMYERQLQMLRNQMSPSTPYAPYSMGAFDPLGLGRLTPSGLPSPSMQSKMEKWARERDELFKKSLAKLRGDIVRANALVREANFLSEEMGKQTEFKVTLQIPAANLSPNRKKGAFVSEPAILVKRKNKGSQVWSMEKLENKLIDMRELYEDCKEKGLLPLKEDDPPKGTDPFYESQENHNLIGVGNVFLEVLFHDVKLDYHVPIISQQGEVAGRLHVEIERTAGTFADRIGDAGADNSRDSIRGSFLDISENSEDSTAGRTVVVRVTIKAASGLPPSLSNFVFCQYTFWGYPDAIVVPPVVNPDYPATRKGKDRMTFKFDHVKDFVVNITEEFVEHCAEGALSIEVWGHRSAGFSNSKPGWEVDAQLLRSRSLADRWAELTRKIELWVDILELNEQGEYAPVEVIAKPDILTGGIFQLRQGQQRRVVVRVKPVQNSGTLPIICEAITSVAIGCICVRSKLQKPLDSYQEEDLTLLREKWSEALMRRREYLDDQIQKIINKQAKADQDVEREQSLIDQWVSLTEERNAVLVPAAGSGIPGAPADWEPPPGMEKHIPVIFLDLSADDMSAPITGENDIRVAGANSILPKEHGSKLFTLPIVKYCEKEVCATAAWDSSIHDSLHLNRVTPQNEHVYLILKASVRLTHPATMDLILRKRLIINVYKKQSFAERIIKKIGRQDFLNTCGVTYEVVSNIPKASEDPEDRESLALMAASGEDAATSDGESYIEKYTRGVSAVESILTLDRLRQEVAMKELLAAQGRPLRKTASVPNIAHIVRMETSPTKLEDQRFAESACDLSLHSSCDNLDRFASRALSTKENKPLNNVTSPVTNSFGLTRPTFLNLNFNLNLSLRQATTSKCPLSAITPQSTKLKPMRTLLEEQRETRPLLYKEESEESGDEEEDKHHNGQESDEEFTEFASYKGTEKVSATDKLDISEIEHPEAIEKPLMQHSSTSDSLVELQTKVGTPSIISSGYGSQVLSTTPVSSEDSASLRSCSVEETPDTDTAKHIHNSADSEKTRLQNEESLQLRHSAEYSEPLLSETCDLPSVPEMPSEIVTNCHGTTSENGNTYTEYNDSLEQFKESIVSNTQHLNESINAVAETTEDKIPPATQSYSRSLSLEQQERRSKLAELQLETTQTRPTSCDMSTGVNGDDTDSQNSNPDETDQDDSTSVGSFESRSDTHHTVEISVPAWLVVGESVMISPYNKTGAVAYVGPTEFAGGAWVGIELDTPTGKNDGSVNGVRYFQCKPRFGIFVRPDKLVIDKRGRAVRAARQATTTSSGKDGLWRSRSKGEGLSSIVDNSIRRSRSRGEGLSTLGTSSDNLRRSRGDGLSKLSEPHHEGIRNHHRGEGIDSTNKPMGSRNRK